MSTSRGRQAELGDPGLSLANAPFPQTRDAGTIRQIAEVDETFDPIDVLRYAIDEFGHTQAELAELLGSRSRASEVLARRRALTVEMIHKIGEAWKIPADLLVRPYKIERAA